VTQGLQYGSTTQQLGPAHAGSLQGEMAGTAAIIRTWITFRMGQFLGADHVWFCTIKRGPVVGVNHTELASPYFALKLSAHS
jgi:hypothetical protein